MERGRGDPTFTLLFGVLLIGIAVAAWLFILLVRPPQAGASLNMAGPAPVTCPTGTHAPVCYRVDATNTGGAPATLHCVVAGAEGTSALFGNDTSAYDSPSPVTPGQLVPLTVKVEAVEGDKIGIPTVSCRLD